MTEQSGEFGPNIRKIRSIKVREATVPQNDIVSSYINSNATSSGPENLERDTSSNSEEKPVSYANGLYAFAILGANVAYCSTFTLIPWSDVYVDPSSWWQGIIYTGMIFMLLRNSLGTIVEVFLVFKKESLMTVKFYFQWWFIVFIGYAIPQCGFYYYWTILKGYNPPMPIAQGLVSFYISMFANWVFIWFYLSKNHRDDTKYKKRIRNYILYLFLWNLIGIQELFLDGIFAQLTSMNFQFLMALIIPLFRRFNEWILPKFFNKALGYKEGWTKLDEDTPATFGMEVAIADVYAFYVAVRLGWAEPFTVYCILGVEFAINLFYCFRIIRLHNKIGERGNDENQQTNIMKAEKESAIISLITVETVEVLIPLGYSLAYATAYYGPNATLFAGVKATYFGYLPQDIENVFSLLYMMFGFDTLGGILISALLAWKCRINVIREYCKIMQKYWYILLLYMSGDLLHVSSLWIIENDIL